MTDSLVFIIPVITLIIGGIFTYFISKLKSEKEISILEERSNGLAREQAAKDITISELNAAVEAIREEKESLHIEITKKEASLNNLQTKLEDQKADIEKLQEKFSKDFEILASKILEDKSQRFTAKNKENIEHILNPLQEKIKSFEKKVEDTNKESIARQSALGQQIIELSKLNERISNDAINLTKALKGDSKKQGDWGEYQLEILLEKVGLQKDIHYSTQGGYRDDDQNLKKPDFIINLPENRHLIIDSKVSLTAYEKYFNADDKLEESTALKSHVSSIRKHFKELGLKKYNDLYSINSPDYVMMFVPIEPALMLALQEENNLYLDALDKNVVLVSASTLLATLTTVASIWKQEDQKRNVIEIAKQAGALYDKFEGLIQDLLKIGNQINASQTSYKAAMNKLSEGKGNLVRRVEILKTLGAKTQKSLPEKILEKAKEE